MGLLNDTSSSDYFMNFTGGHYDFVAWDPRGVGLSTLVLPTPISLPSDVPANNADRATSSALIASQSTMRSSTAPRRSTASR